MKMNVYKYNNGGWAVERVGFKTTIYVDFEKALEMVGCFCKKHNTDTDNVVIYTPKPTLQF